MKWASTAMVTFFVLGLGAVAIQAGVSTGVILPDPEAEHAKAKKRAETWYKGGMKALAEGNTREAVKQLLWVAKMGRMRVDSPYPEQAYEQLKALAVRASQDLAVARELVAGADYEAGLIELKRIMRTYSGLGPAKDAGILLRALSEDTAFNAVLRAQGLRENLEEARALEKEADAMRPPAPPEGEVAETETESTDASPSEVAETETESTDASPSEVADEVPPEEWEVARLEKLAEALALYERIVKQGGETAPAREAAKAVARLQADAALMAYVQQANAEQQARQWLELAKNYLQAGRFDLAYEYGEKVISRYPDSPSAGEARGLLNGLEPPVPPR